LEETGDISSACKDWRVAASLGDQDAADWVSRQCQQIASTHPQKPLP